MRSAMAVLLVVVLSACGFHLRGSYDLPWQTVYISLPEYDLLRAQIRRSIESSSQTRVVNDPKDAQAVLLVTHNQPLRNILSLNAKGLVRELQLTRVFAYRVQDANGKEILPVSQIILQREMTFDDERLFAKEAEEAMIVNEMQQDLVQQLMRRLAAATRNLGK